VKHDYTYARKDATALFFRKKKGGGAGYGRNEESPQCKNKRGQEPRPEEENVKSGYKKGWFARANSGDAFFVNKKKDSSGEIRKQHNSKRGHERREK
jgi:hypothetical protein